MSRDPAHPADFRTNHPHQHAFMLVGSEAVFAVHMTQYHHEEHKYQLVLKLTLTPAAMNALGDARKRFPTDTFVLCNDDTDLFMIPEVLSGRRCSFKANLFQGLPAFTEEEESDPHFSPGTRRAPFRWLRLSSSRLPGS